MLALYLDCNKYFYTSATEESVAVYLALFWSNAAVLRSELQLMFQRPVENFALLLRNVEWQRKRQNSGVYNNRQHCRLRDDAIN